MKRALVTGGARRIGAAFVQRLSEMGFEVWIHCRESRFEAEALAASLPHVHVSVCDFADSNAFAVWLTKLPDFDVLVNNASCYRLTKNGEPESPEIRKRYFDVNVTVPVALTNRVQSGCVVNLLDADILAPDGGVLPPLELPDGVDSYLESRKCLARKTLEMARTMAPRVRVNGIAPGAVLPPVDCAGPGMQKILARIPLAHPVAVAELADALELLVKSSSLTGVILPVDGGMHLKE